MSEAHEPDPEIETLFEAALSCPSDERSTLLKERCRDPELREEVSSLVRAYEDATGFFDSLAESVRPSLEKLADLTPADEDRPGRPDPMNLEGEEMAGYLVEQYLGGGGMGRVYRAEDPQLERKVALKFLPPHLASDAEAAQRFDREARAAATLDHPHVGTIYETGRTDEDRPFIAMAYYAGRSLKDELEEGPLPVQKALTYGTQTAEGLGAAHQARIVHRDVKPGNVLLTSDDQVKIVDFGLAYVTEQSRITESGQRLGTASYMSPEQARGQAVDRRADMWGLGAILYEMLAGKRPFSADRKMAVLQAILHEEPESLRENRPDAPRSLRQVIRRCLAKDPDRRYPTCSQLIEDLETVQSSETALSIPTSAFDWTPEGETSPSLAVLPFETIGDEEPGPFTRGLHGDLITRLANVAGLQVIGRTSVDQYADAEQPVQEIAEATGADWILEGEIQNAAEGVRVLARLIDTDTHEQEWSGAYQRTLEAERLFDLQVDLTKDIAGSLEAELTESESERIEQEGTQDLDAYRLYLRGRRELARRMEGDIDEAFEYFRRAIRKDPDYALAWSGLADTAGNEWWGSEKFGELDITPEEAARRALELEPDLAEAHTSMGLVHHRQHDAPAALREYQKAIRLKPSYAEARAWLGLTYLVIGRQNDGTDQLELAVELDPEHLVARHLLYDTYIDLGKPKEALEAVREQIERYPNLPSPRYAQTRALYKLEQYEKAHAVATEHIPPSLDIPGTYDFRASYLATIEAAMGDTERARRRMETLKEQHANPVVLTYARAALEDVEGAISELETVESWNYVATHTARYSTFPTGLQQVRAHPRFEKILGEVNQSWGLEQDGSLSVETTQNAEQSS